MGTAWIAGATGLTGRHCLDALLSSGRYSTVVALTRRPTGLRHPLLLEAPADGSGAPRPDDVFCAIGTTIGKAGSKDAFRDVDLRLVLRVAQNAAGASQFVLVSSAGAHAPGLSFYLQVKRDTEQALAKVGFGALHIFRPSVLIGARAERRTAERAGIAIARALAWTMIGSMRKYRPVEAAMVAKAMVAAALSGAMGVHIYHYDEIVELANR